MADASMFCPVGTVVTARITGFNDQRDGGTSGIRLGGFTDDGRRFQYNDIVCGAWGARPGLDGLDGSAGIAANLANRSIEMAEREDPVTVLEYGFVPDTEGAGRYRGGLAIRRAVRLLAPSATLAIRTHRRITPPYGLAGGLPGSTSTTYLIPDGGTDGAAGEDRDGDAVG
jgi:N-methylhydantoinase B